MPRVKYAMDYHPRNCFSMTCASRMVIFPGDMNVFSITSTLYVGVPGWRQVSKLIQYKLVVATVPIDKMIYTSSTREFEVENQLLLLLW